MRNFAIAAIGGVLGLGVAGVLVTSSLVSAQGHGLESDAGGVEFRRHLAEELGIEEGEFCDAHKTVRLEMLDESLAEGEISDEKAVEIRERIEESECGLPIHEHRGPRGPSERGGLRN